MKRITCFWLFFALSIPVFSQGPYKLNKFIDGPIILGGMGASYFGLQYLRDKPHLDSTFITTLKQDDISKFDRGATRNYNEKASISSDIALFGSIAIPFALVFDKKVNKDILTVGALYLETMTIMANAYVWGVGSTHRIRPFVYNPDVPFGEKLKRGTTNSFFAGHPATAAASTFFFAKVFNDYHPDSKLKYVFWGAAIVPPAVVAYYRYEHGQHFPTDILAGIPIGMAIGILTPHLHKVKNNSNLSLYPAPGGLGMVYKIK
jgi:membrane-associated phospholipid phosphatase